MKQILAIIMSLLTLMPIVRPDNDVDQRYKAQIDAHINKLPNWCQHNTGSLREGLELLTKKQYHETILRENDDPIITIKNQSEVDCIKQPESFIARFYTSDENYLCIFYMDINDNLLHKEILKGEWFAIRLYNKKYIGGKYKGNREIDWRYNDWMSTLVPFNRYFLQPFSRLCNRVFTPESCGMLVPDKRTSC